AFAALGAAPLAAYAGWFHSAHGTYALTSSDGVFLYSRTMTFADCAKINPPQDLLVLCDSRPPGRRSVPSDYIWHAQGRHLEALPHQPAGHTIEDRFADSINGPARRFAVRAIAAQPGDYLRAAFGDFRRAFSWHLDDHYPHPVVVRAYQFSTTWEMQPTAETVLVA